MVRKILKRIRRGTNKEGDTGIIEKNAEIFNTNNKIISKSMERSFMGMIDIDQELLKTGMIAG
ncbi:MAG: hypothetical protein GW779_00490 [Candidatus Altiarchaeum hamiconexum]|uniref:Uncharacterized protein n=1 Tax=Candidatus Altarchaeum hamiconexum TaxID=1803513 RepID=A0A8J7YTK0_9ARCH|nr:hypothetical protein [Candidatus Altarchaeum hamiconexum]OIQ05882.1 MAG: hypothetical protein AUK59_02135 [Candidatus Altarchaeum sp. CG2_30_32_3053]PIX48352.1 MAG: hypothetical protein COZ53_04305 [Candidatus Altarchaeum sp. CG_4_8_14_3_um_filter_33_2054]PIZ29234.1 MAG: hypothetical protein COY41_06380 [Candidatus Altarchaeum sp. CG_4_10_14_0_8_um_filter_32_851]PJC13716.1 MAG: hypothetical protein CO063_03740 [Candidatus Altarchaeum sp. CG_4_9_14_0_8_um_filter_32_206]